MSLPKAAVVLSLLVVPVVAQGYSIPAELKLTSTLREGEWLVPSRYEYVNRRGSSFAFSGRFEPTFGSLTSGGSYVDYDVSYSDFELRTTATLFLDWNNPLVGSWPWLDHSNETELHMKIVNGIEPSSISTFMESSATIHRGSDLGFARFSNSRWQTETSGTTTSGPKSMGPSALGLYNDNGTIWRYASAYSEGASVNMNGWPSPPNWSGIRIEWESTARFQMNIGDAPTAAITRGPGIGNVESPALFRSNSTDPDNTVVEGFGIVLHRWSVTGSTDAARLPSFVTDPTGRDVQVLWQHPGTFTFTVMARDDEGWQVTDSETVTISAGDGDANFDERVDFADLLILAQNYGATGDTAVWRTGDFTNDYAVDFDDLLALAQQYGAEGFVAGSSFEAEWALARSLVPEPAAAAILFAGLTISRRRAC